MYLAKSQKGAKSYYQLCETVSGDHGQKTTKLVAYLGADLASQEPLITWWKSLGRPPIFWRLETDKDYFWRIEDLEEWFSYPSHETVRERIAEGLKMVMAESNQVDFFEEGERFRGRWRKEPKDAKSAPKETLFLKAGTTAWRKFLTSLTS
jgi:hypothetical protein